MDKNEFEFPDEIEAKAGGEVEAKKEDAFDFEIEDDTPEQDRGREPMPKELVQELEQDELEDYSEKVKTRLKQMKKVWHDERRDKDQAYRCRLHHRLPDRYVWPRPTPSRQRTYTYQGSLFPLGKAFL